MLVLARILVFLYTFADADTAIKGINEERGKREKRDRKVMERACRAKKKK